MHVPIIAHNCRIQHSTEQFHLKPTCFLFSMKLNIIAQLRSIEGGKMTPAAGHYVDIFYQLEP